VPVNDRSKDSTREIIDEVVTRYPGRIRPFHRVDGKPGKAAALKDATETVDTDFIIVFDADYLPSRGLIRRLMAPFLRPGGGRRDGPRRAAELRGQPADAAARPGALGRVPGGPAGAT